MTTCGLYHVNDIVYQNHFHLCFTNFYKHENKIYVGKRSGADGWPGVL